MFNDYLITMDSFGDTCPANWEEIAAYLNAIIDGYVDDLTTTDADGVEAIDWQELHERTEILWTEYCSNQLPDAPAPVFDAEPARHWYIVDDCTSTRSFCDTDQLNVTGKDEAIAEAVRRWNALTPYDQFQRDAYYVCSAQTDDDGAFDYRTEEDIYDIK